MGACTMLVYDDLQKQVGSHKGWNQLEFKVCHNLNLAIPTDPPHGLVSQTISQPRAVFGLLDSPFRSY